MQKYYKILDLPYDASLSEIKQAYRELVRIWHPDRYMRDERLQRRANAKLIELNEAYRMLCSITPATSADQEDEYPFADPIDWSMPSTPKFEEQNATEPSRPYPVGSNPITGRNLYYGTLAALVVVLFGVFFMNINAYQPQYTSQPFPPPENIAQITFEDHVLSFDDLATLENSGRLGGDSTTHATTDSSRARVR